MAGFLRQNANFDSTNTAVQYDVKLYIFAGSSSELHVIIKSETDNDAWLDTLQSIDPTSAQKRTGSSVPSPTTSDSADTTGTLQPAAGHKRGHSTATATNTDKHSPSPASQE